MQKTTFRGFTLYYRNRDAMESMCREAEHFETFFTPRPIRPLIVDCGANIGVSVLYWKSLWPSAEVLCFEPDPGAFDLLQRNVNANDLANVTCHRIAISDSTGTAPFFGDLSVSGDARGNSLESAWGERPGTAQCVVNCDCLSNYIEGRRVDFLKLDIEGAEFRVIEDLGKCLNQIDAIYLELHQAHRLGSAGGQQQITELLEQSGFETEIESRGNAFALPPEHRRWQQSAGAKQTQLIAWRR